jgi:hypothetical protein
MPRTTRSKRSVWARTFCALALALSASGAGCGDEASREPSDEDDDVSQEESPTDAPPKRDAASGEGTRDAATARDSGGAGAADSAVAEPMRDAGSSQPPRGRDGGQTVDAAGRSDAAMVTPVPVGDGGSVSGIPDEELAMLRQVCVDEINRYRATLSLAPIQRANSAQELCSDQGAKKDGDSKQAHSSAGGKNPCVVPGVRPAFPGFGSQNTCPSWPVRGSGTIATALKGCLMQMWAEGEPPGGEAKCKEDYFAGNTACFLAHGHYLNMKGNSKGVSCGFYKNGTNTYWMNQDFF